jgi:hypothetical protein
LGNKREANTKQIKTAGSRIFKFAIIVVLVTWLWRRHERFSFDRENFPEIHDKSIKKASPWLTRQDVYLYGAKLV